MFNFLLQPFGLILQYIYKYLAFGNYGIAIILFTLFVKILLFPLTLKQQLSTIKTQALQPELAALKKTYGKDNQAYMQEQQKLYAKYGVNPMAGCLPTLLMFPVIIVVYQIIRGPLTFISGISSTTLKSLSELAKAAGIATDELSINSWLLSTSGTTDSAAQLLGNSPLVNMNFLGLDLGIVPTKAFSSWSYVPLLLIPVLVLVSQYVVQWFSSPTRGQKKDKGQKDPTQRGMGLMMKLMPIMTFVIALITPAALGFYWLVSNLLTLLQTYLINTFFIKKNEKEVQ
ncbi:MAG: YidC/Oxa1 family membrane protein insertase [Clostridia bacterium]|nr:YidC/Oxa1 family membrane protein insertase [Clostridia bacterium]